MNTFYSPKFLRSFKKLPRDIKNEFRIQEQIFRENPFSLRLKTHKLKGKNEWSFLVTYKIRVIFILEKDAALLVNIGDHSIYRK